MSIVNRNDRHDTDPVEAKLIRIGHFLWKLYLEASAEAGMEDGLRTVWAAKASYRQELKVRREESSRQLRKYWAARKAA
jgi:hypothetical protein